MKHLIYLIVFVCMSCQSGDSTTINGTFVPFESDKAFLIELLSRDTIGRADIHESQFVMHVDFNTSDESLSGMLLCRRSDGQQSTAAPIAVEKGTIHISFNKRGYAAYSGTPLQVYFSDFVESMMQLDLQLQQSNTVIENDSLVKRMGELLDTFYIENRNGSIAQFVSMLTSDQIAKGTVDPADLTQISALCKNSPDSIDKRVCSTIRAFYEKWEGTPVRPFKGTTADSTTFSLDDLDESKPFIIDFWASWCGPCIKEFPKLRALYDAGKVDIIGVSIDANHNAWLTALTKLDLPWHNIRDADEELKKLYNVTAVPAKFLVDKTGIIVARNPENLEEAIQLLEY